MMKKITRVWCWIVGHNWVTGSRFETNREPGYSQSQWGHSECARCGETYRWQWDD